MDRVLKPYEVASWMRALVYFLALSLGISAASSLAQSGSEGAEGDPWAGVEEMIVTSSGDVILTQIATSSAIGFDAEMLQAEGISDVSDLAAFTPNLEIKTAFAAVNPTIFLRGVGLDDFNSNSASAVSILQDGIYMNSPAGQLFGLFDVEAAEVLRGPQPTITNASAGAILIRSNPPTDEFEASLISTFGNYNLKQFEGVLNVPVIPERLRVRGAFKIQQRDGVTRNMCPAIIKSTADITDPGELIAARGPCAFADPESLSPPRFPAPGPSESGKDWVNDQDNWAARGLVSYAMPLPDGQQIDWLLSVNGGRNQSLAAQYQHQAMARDREPIIDPTTGETIFQDIFYSRNPANGAIPKDAFNYTQTSTLSDAFAGEYDRVGPERLDLFGVSLKGDWSPSDTLDVSSLSGYFWHDRETFANDDAGPKSWLNNDYTDDAWQFTQETTATWLWSEESEATFGGYFLMEELDANNIFRDNRNLTNNPKFVQDQEQDTFLWALFASTTIELPPLPHWGEFVENFTIDGSVRYNWASKEMRNVATRVSGPQGLSSLQSNVGAETDRWSAWTFDAILTYYFTEEISAYFKVSRGWKPGHFNALTLNSLQAVGSVNPETLDSLEGALRASWFEGRLVTNLTAFTYAYQDLQVFQVTVDAVGKPLRRLINSEEAEIWGVEWEFEAEPLERLKLAIAGGYLNSEYTDFSTTFERSQFIFGQGAIVFETDVDYSGNRLLASPEWSLTGSAEYTIPTAIGDFTPRFSFSYRDDVFFDANEGCGAEGNIPECLLEQPSLWLFNATLRYSTLDGRLEILAFVRNFLDKEYRVQAFDLTSTNGILLSVYGEPRTFGAALTLRFD